MRLNWVHSLIRAELPWLLSFQGLLWVIEVLSARLLRLSFMMCFILFTDLLDRWFWRFWLHFNFEFMSIIVWKSLTLPSMNLEEICSRRFYSSGNFLICMFCSFIKFSWVAFNAQSTLTVFSFEIGTLN